MSGEARADAGASAAATTPLAIICGGGNLPFAVADAVQAKGRRVVLFPIRGFADPQRVLAYPHHWIWLGRYGAFRRLALREGCRDVVMIGGLQGPSLRQIKLDWKTVRAFPRIIAAFRGGDDHLLSGIARIMEDDGL